MCFHFKMRSAFHPFSGKFHTIRRFKQNDGTLTCKRLQQQYPFLLLCCPFVSEHYPLSLSVISHDYKSSPKYENYFVAIHCICNGFWYCCVVLRQKCSYSFIVVEDNENSLSSNDKYAKLCANDENK